ncbi:MAG: hypothetical protein KQH63_13455 [Desulfobulbaceae bacterium]|nr:hypothetical protein [Desulfobulbaceae bacterium]
MKKIFILVTGVVFLSGIIFPLSALAHKVKIFAAVEGKSIDGYAYYTSSSRPKNVKIILAGPGGKVIDELISNEQGEFDTEARYRVDTLVKLDSADGHSAEWLITKEEFPADLPEYPGAGETLKDVNTGQEPSTSLAEAATGNAVSLAADTKELAALIRSELVPLQKQLAQLRAELAEQEEKKKLQDILGGIGYLIGLAGIASYIAARRRKEH